MLTLFYKSHESASFLAISNFKCVIPKKQNGELTYFPHKAIPLCKFWLRSIYNFALWGLSSCSLACEEIASQHPAIFTSEISCWVHSKSDYTIFISAAWSCALMIEPQLHKLPPLNTRHLFLLFFSCFNLAFLFTLCLEISEKVNCFIIY